MGEDTTFNVVFFPNEHYHLEVYSDPYQTSKIELFAKIAAFSR